MARHALSTRQFESSIFHLHDEKSEHEHGRTSTSEDDLMKLLNLPECTQTWTRFDKRAKTCRTTSSSGPLWENVVARITIDDETGHIMSLEYTKYMSEKDLHRNLPSVRDIRTVLVHFSPVTPNQQLKQSFQTFAALSVDETTQQTSQIQTAVQDELSVGSERPRVIAKALFKSLILSAVSLDGAVVDPWMKTTRYGRVDFDVVCCTEWSSDVAWWTCRTEQSLEWLRSHHKGRDRQIERGSS